MRKGKRGIFTPQWVGEIIRKERLKHQKTQLELAQEANLSVKIVSILEQGKRPSFDEATLIRVARVLDLTLENLLNLPDPEVTFITDTDDDEQLRFLEDSFECAKSLFPDHALLDSLPDIIKWQDQIRHSKDSPWRMIYAVLHIGECVFGMAYFDMHLKRHWCCGYNFGVKAPWRPERQAEIFFNRVEEELRRIDPDYKGILFEVEPVNFELLAEVAKRKKIAGFPDEYAICSNIRNLRRLVLFEYHGARILLAANGRPLPYRQPSIGKLDTTDERELILMVWPRKDFKQENFDLKEVLDFIYDDVYAYAYEDDVPGYRQYVTSIKERVYGASSGSQLGTVTNQGLYYKLIYCAMKEGLKERIDL